MIAAANSAHGPCLLDAASAPYRRAGQFAWRFARGKFGMDPVFSHLLREDREALGDAAEFVCGDMRTTPFPESDAVVILDVLHHITIAEQNQVLARARGSVRPGGRLLLRVGDAASTRGFRISRWVDAVVTFVRGQRALPQFGRTLSAWRGPLESLGFDVLAQPMSQGTPFANVLLIATVRAVP